MQGAHDSAALAAASAAYLKHRTSWRRRHAAVVTQSQQHIKAREDGIQQRVRGFHNNNNNNNKKKRKDREDEEEKIKNEAANCAFEL